MKTFEILVRTCWYNPGETEPSKGRIITLPAMPNKVFFACKVKSGYMNNHKKIWAIVDPISGVPLSCQQWISERLRDVKNKANDHLLNDLPVNTSFDEYIKEFMTRKGIGPLESNIQKLTA
jgi:hypothetical protein